MLIPPPHMPVYPLLPLNLVKGRYASVFDEQGVEYLDMYGGHAVTVLGHNHPKLVEAIKRQCDDLLFYSNIVGSPMRDAFCSALVKALPAGLDSVFLCNSGAEANDIALTLARMVTGRRAVVSVEGGFHGRTLWTLAVAGLEGYRNLALDNAGPLLPDTRVLPRNDVAAVEKLVDGDCAAVIVEPVQGLAGGYAMTTEFLQAMKDRCDEVGAILIFDEVQCGVGRTGAYSAAETYGINPNIISMAKGIAGGVPCGAVVADDHVAAVATKGKLGSTFGGNPLASAAGLAVLEVLADGEYMGNVRRISAWLIDKLAGVPGVQTIHGRGFLLGLELDRPAAGPITELIEKHHILTGGAQNPAILRLLPPYCLTDQQAADFVAALTNVME